MSIRIFRNNDIDYDDPEPDHGLTITDYTLLDLIEYVDTEVYGVEKIIRDATPKDRQHLLQGTRSVADQALVDLVEPFWDDEVWVVVYEVDRVYGGPEEGGWAFNVFEKVGAYKMPGASWTEMIHNARTCAGVYRDYYRKQEYGTLGSYGDSLHYDIAIEIVPQAFDEKNGPGKLERQPTPRWS